MEKHKNSIGNMLVLSVMTYWGFTTILMKHALHYMNSNTYIMLRFSIAAVLVGIFYQKRLRQKWNKRLVAHGLLLGLLLAIPMECSTMAMYFTSASNSVFIGQLSFALVPLIQCLLQKRTPDRLLMFTMAGLLFGLIIFSNLLSTGLNAGDMIAVISAVFNAITILIFNRFAQTDDPQLLGVLQIISAAIISIPLWLVRPGGVQWNKQAIYILMLTGVIGSAVAFIISAVGQAKTTPIQVAFISLVQPVFGMFGAAIIADEFGVVETVTGQKIIGAVIILLALLFYLYCQNKKNKN